MLPGNTIQGSRDNLRTGMNVAERPVVVPTTHQVVDGAWRIVLVRAGAARGVQQADVEQSVDRIRVAERQVGLDRGYVEALPVHRHGHALPTGA